MKKRFYVYIYLDPRKTGKWEFKDITFEFQPFYVGKGSAARDLFHTHPWALKNRKGHRSSTIVAIKKEGKNPIVRRIFTKLTEKQAIHLEIACIKKFGRRDNQTGILCNHSNGGDGDSSQTVEFKRKAGSGKKPVWQYDLDGKLVRKWRSVAIASEALGVQLGNISTAIQRNGTACNAMWSFSNLGSKIPAKLRCQMPVKYKNIRKFKLDGTFLCEFPNVRQAALSLRKTSCSFRTTHCKILDCLKGNLKSAFGFFWSTEQSPKIPVNNSFRPVSQYSKDGVFIASYPTQREAAKKTNNHFGNINAACIKKSTSGGFKWRYENKEQ